MQLASSYQPAVPIRPGGTAALPAEPVPWASVMIDHLDWGLALCSAEGRLIHANRAAQREFACGEPLAIVDGLICDQAGSRAEWRHGLHDAATRQRTRLLFAGGDGGQLPVVVMPVQLDDSGLPAVLVMIGRRALCSALGLQMLASRRGLTLAEQRVMRGLIANQSARRIADDNHVAISTVRTQIQSIRDKFGVKSVDALLVLAGQLPPVGS